MKWEIICGLSSLALALPAGAQQVAPAQDTVTTGVAKGRDRLDSATSTSVLREADMEALARLNRTGATPAYERAMLRPDDTIRLYTSPYRRTRETAEGLLGSLTETTEELGPSPFKREDIIVREEPRLREQDFGNFQPCSAEMERMWQERADYGHFFYRIPNGESAADAYDRISGFNDSLWRSFGEDDFPSVLILVTHGLMTRVFLMRW